MGMKGDIPVISQSEQIQALIEKIDEDITVCANFCDVYTNRCTWSKVLRSSTWSGKIKVYLECFETCCSDFQQALSFYIGHVVNTVNTKIDAANSALTDISQKYGQIP